MITVQLLNLVFRFYIGAKTSSAGVQYAVKLRKSGISLISATEMYQKWPEQLMTFLEGQITFKTDGENGALIHKFGRLANITGIPLRILGCSNYDGFGYLCDWSGLTKYFVSSQIARTEFPHLVVEFLQEKLNFSESTNNPKKITYGDYIIMIKLK